MLTNRLLIFLSICFCILFVIVPNGIQADQTLDFDTLKGIDKDSSSPGKSSPKKPAVKKPIKVKPGPTHKNQQLSASDIFVKAEPTVVVIVLKIKGQYAGHGSGFIVKANGYILTNNHVVDASGFGRFARMVTYEVITADGRTFTPQIIKTDPELDIALLKITGKRFSTVKMGDVGHVKVGEDVFVIGTPIRLEFRRSMTSGLISGFDRRGGRIQVSAILHGGNSGGPAFNRKGEVIGIAVAVAAGINREKAYINNTLVSLITKQQYYGVSYLIPINYAKNLLNLMY